MSAANFAPLSQWQCLRADLDRYLELSPGYPHQSPLRKLKVALTEEAFWVIAWYRFGRWLTVECRVPVLRQLLLVVYLIGFRWWRVLFGISLSRSSDVGPGLYIGHWSGVWINPDVHIGRRATISHGVTVGVGGTGAMAGVPRIGHHVYIAPHAVVAGKITIGDGVSIGANSTVIAPVPDGCSVIGVPARVVARGANAVAERAKDDPSAPSTAGASAPLAPLTAEPASP